MNAGYPVSGRVHRPAAHKTIVQSQHLSKTGTTAGLSHRQSSLAREFSMEPRTQRMHASTDAAASSGAPPASEQASEQQQPSTSAAGPAALVYTSFEGNSWRAEFGASGVRILVDPWLVDELTFGGVGFFYTGAKRVARADTIDIDKLAAETDLIVLTMGIDDHAHRPTLKRLPKSLPVVGSPSAAAVARQLGFHSVVEVHHRQEVAVCGGRMTVRATQGALVGPPWSTRENGFVLSEQVPGGVRLYYEPHADYVAASVAEVGRVDVVVSPPSTQSLLGYQLVKGATENVALLELLRPKVVVPLMNAEFDARGVLNSLLTESGGPREMEAQLRQVPELRAVRVCLPRPGVPMPVHL